jgi:hypothetical protein
MPDNIADAEEADAKILASITTADELEQFLLDHWDEHVLVDDIHESKSAEAAEINNEGMAAQITYLAGDSDVDIPALARALAERLYSYSPRPAHSKGTHMPDDSNLKFIAHYTPEAWVNDNAIETDPEGEQEWDATEAVYAVKGWADKLVAAMPADSYNREFGVVDRDDILKTDRNAPAWVRQHRGPCTIRVRLADRTT